MRKRDRTPRRTIPRPLPRDRPSGERRPLEPNVSNSKANSLRGRRLVGHRSLTRGGRDSLSGLFRRALGIGCRLNSLLLSVLDLKSQISLLGDVNDLEIINQGTYSMEGLLNS